MIQYQSKLFGKTRKDISKDEVSTNAQLLMRAGFIEKAMAGVYTYLPLGLRVFRKVENIVREEMDKLGAQEMLMTAFQPKEIWEETGRWQDKVGGSMYQFKDSSNKDIGLAPTHEEMLADIVKKHVSSYKDLPMYLYQIQTKFRDEPRAKSGLLRGREFSMKDLYSFNRNEEEFQKFYDKVHDVYLKIFKRMGLKAFSVEASGGAMSKKFSHEFMVETPAGEDITVVNKKTGKAQNKEIAENFGKDYEEIKTVEAGNIFDLETKYSKPLKVEFVDKDGKSKPIYMGSYGIGIGRAVGTIVEASHDDKGIIWTKEVTPYHVHVITLGEDKKVQDTTDKLIKSLPEEMDILVDDRDLTVGQKLNDADLIGVPVQVIIGSKNLPEVEFKERKDNKTKKVKTKDVPTLLKRYYA